MMLDDQPLRLRLTINRRSTNQPLRLSSTNNLSDDVRRSIFQMKFRDQPLQASSTLGISGDASRLQGPDEDDLVNNVTGVVLFYPYSYDNQTLVSFSGIKLFVIKISDSRYEDC